MFSLAKFLKGNYNYVFQTNQFVRIILSHIIEEMQLFPEEFINSLHLKQNLDHLTSTALIIPKYSIECDKKGSFTWSEFCFVSPIISKDEIFSNLDSSTLTPEATSKLSKTFQQSFPNTADNWKLGMKIVIQNLLEKEDSYSKNKLFKLILRYFISLRAFRNAIIT